MSGESVLHSRLEAARRDLLDLTARNRLLNTPRRATRARNVEVVDDCSERIFRVLVQAGKAMTFAPSPETEVGDQGAGVGDQGSGGGDQRAAVGDQRSADDGLKDDDGQNRPFSSALTDPTTEKPDEAAQKPDGLDSRIGRRETELCTRLDSDRLQKRLLAMHYDARVSEEEQGVNILYLALGFLKWYEVQHSDKPRYAPLLLIPVTLERQSVHARFRLRYLDEDITTNLSLQAKLKLEFGIELPSVPELDDLSPPEYFAAVAAAVAHQPGWEVQPDETVLWFFSFAKFLMYRDLDPANWPEGQGLDGHPLIEALLHEGFGDDPPLCDESDRIDDHLDPADTIHVMDADSSQTLAIEEVRRGRNLVIQGPPGTGKSQTITNMIATAVRDGKRVLFVAEKMAALEVVKSRLDAIGLGDLCLELHSHKAAKRAVLEQLNHTLNLGRPAAQDFAKQAARLREARDRLNRHAEALHTPVGPSEFKPFEILGELVRLQAEGIEPPEFQLTASAAWTRSDFLQKRRLVQDVLVHLEEIGPPPEHPWRGVRLETPLLPADIQRLTARFPAIVESLRKLIALASGLAELLNRPAAVNAVELRTQAQWLQKLLKAPTLDRRSIADDAWDERRDEIARLIEVGRTLAECRRELDGVAADVAWDADAATMRRHLAAHGESWFRWFNRDYRQAQAGLRGILNGKPPKPLPERIQLLDTLIQGQQARAVLNDPAQSELGRRAFGRMWQGDASDWDALGAVVTWETECRAENLPGDARQILSELNDTSAARSLLGRVAEQLQAAFRDVRAVFQELRLDLPFAFGTDGSRTIPLAELAGRFERWSSETEAMSRWVLYFLRWRGLREEGLQEFADFLQTGRLSAEDAYDAFEHVYYNELMREVYRRWPEIAGFDGRSHEQLIAEFHRLDRERIVLARRETALAHCRGIPRRGSGIGEMGVVQWEIEKKRRHKPIRQLVKEAGTAVSAIKPVFMMSPISVAQYLEPGAIEFDLLLIDEASQIRPVDALGAIARSRQIVVVGDDRQLPPTRFFNKVLSEDATSEDDGQPHAGDLESILGLCSAQRMPSRMLRWHYRSRHHSLIAVSNREFYDGRLFVIPSPSAAANGQGLHFHHVHDGVFDRGGTATNRVEAQRIADAVIEHARHCPHLTLGVGTFSMAQRDAVLDELELRRQDNPEAENFFARGRTEPFFVKNLENIQGDERDVILISVGYGRDASGFLSMGFGPLSTEGGERRLNVLITRARERCEVYSSITADDIDLRRAKSRGAAALKTFLHYAATGVLDVGRPTGRGFDSEFERQVARALERLGYDLEPQVGVAGFFVDLAVLDSEQPGRYVLGIECDGAAYHSSRSARDRDRLRQQVLEDRGWTIHRIWSTDWFKRPDEQVMLARAAVEQARSRTAVPANWRRGPAASAANDGEAIPRPDTIERTEVDAETNGAPEGVCPNGGIPYEEAQFEIDETRAVHELPVRKLSRIAVQVVKIEGPVHAEEITRRIATLSGRSRVGQRVARAVEDALKHAVRTGKLDRDGDFYTLKGQAEIPVRNREQVVSSGLRRAEMLPSSEIRAGLVQVVEHNLGAPPDDVCVAAARLFGFRTTSPQLKQLFEQHIERLLADGRLCERNGKLYGTQCDAVSNGD